MEREFEILGQRIRNLREDMDLTQKDLAAQIGLTPKMISFYENNQRTPPVDILLKFSHIFNVSSDYLLGLDTPISYRKAAPLEWKEVAVAYPNAIILQDEDKELLDYYYQLSLKNRRWIMGQMIDLIKKEEDNHSNPSLQKSVAGL